MQINISKKDIYWSYLNYGSNVLSNMIVLMFAVAILPEKELGMWYTFLSLGAIVQLIDFGFLPCITRNISFAWSGAMELKRTGVPSDSKGSANIELLNKLVYSSKWLYSFLAILVILLCYTIGLFYIVSIAADLNISYVITGWVVYAFSLVINIYFGYWSGCLQGIGAIRENNVAKVISFLTLIVVSVICLYLSLGIIAMAIGNFASGIVYRLIAKFYFTNYKDIKGSIILKKSVGFDAILDTLKIIWPNAWKMGINSIGTYFITQGNTLLCSSFLGLSATATYGLSLQICNAIVTVAKILMTAYQPQLVELNLKKDIAKVKKRLSLIMIVYWLIIVVSGIALVTIGIPLIGMIKKDTVLPYAVVLYMLFYLALEGNHSCFTVYLTTRNEVPFVKAGIISAVMVFLASLLLVNITDWRIWALMIGQSFVQLAYNNWKWPYVVLKQLSLTPFTMAKTGMSELISSLKKCIYAKS